MGCGICYRAGPGWRIHRHGKLGLAVLLHYQRASGILCDYRFAIVPQT
jgi:hypothetical protein